MKTNVTMLNILTVFNLVVAAIYGYWTYIADGEIEVIGFAALVMLVFLTGFISFYLAFFASMLNVACGTAFNRFSSINLPVARHTP